MAAAQGIGSVLGGLGTIFAGDSAKSEGETAYKYSLFNAANDRLQGQYSANKAMLSGTMAGQEQERINANVMSSARAAAAAGGGGGVAAPSILGIMGKTMQRGDYVAGSKVAAGQASAATDIANAENQANIDIMQGQAAKARGKNAWLGSLLGGGGQIAGGAGKWSSATDWGGGGSGVDPISGA